MIQLPATALTPGTAAGRLTVLAAPLSLWGGFSIFTGSIIDANHPQQGVCLTGRILAMRFARGSSSSSSALVESARAGTAPAAIVLGRPDPILIIGSLVAFDLYQVAIPILVLAPEHWPDLADGAATTISTSGVDTFVTIG